MSEQEKFFPEESLEQKKERLRPIFERSLELFRDSDWPLPLAIISIVRKDFRGENQSIADLVVSGIEDEAVSFCSTAKGEVGPAISIPWEEIVDAIAPLEQTH